MEIQRNRMLGHISRKDPAVLREVRDLLQDSISLDEVYVTASKKSKTATPVSEMLNNPKVVYNAKSLDESRVKQLADAESLIDLVYDK